MKIRMTPHQLRLAAMTALAAMVCIAMIGNAPRILLAFVCGFSAGLALYAIHQSAEEVFRLHKAKWKIEDAYDALQKEHAALKMKSGQPKGLWPPASVQAAMVVLGVTGEIPRRGDVIQKHREAIATAHPDRGGSQAQAVRINAARDVLLRFLDVLEHRWAANE